MSEPSQEVQQKWKELEERWDKTTKNLSELLKFWQDTLKHLTPLSSGGILILAAFIDKNLAASNKLLTGIIFACLIVSLIASVLAMSRLFTIHMALSFREEPSIRLMKKVSRDELFSVFCFILGLLFLVILVIIR